MMESLRAEREGFDLKVSRFQVLLEKTIEGQPVPASYQWASWPERGQDFAIAEDFARQSQPYLLGTSITGANIDAIMDLFFSKNPPILVNRCMIRSYKIARCFIHCFQRDRAAFCGPTANSGLDINGYTCPFGKKHICYEFSQDNIASSLEYHLHEYRIDRLQGQRRRFAIQSWHEAALKRYLEDTRRVICIEEGISHSGAEMPLTAEERSYEEACAKYSEKDLATIIHNFELFHRMEKGTATFEQVQQSEECQKDGLQIFSPKTVGEVLLNYECFYGVPHGSATLGLIQSSSSVGLREWAEGRALVEARLNYEKFYGLPCGTVTLDQIKSSSAGLKGWATEGCARSTEPKEQTSDIIIACQHEKARSDEQESRLYRLALLESVGACPAGRDERAQNSDYDPSENSDSDISYEYSSSPTDDEEWDESTHDPADTSEPAVVESEDDSGAVEKEKSKLSWMRQLLCQICCCRGILLLCIQRKPKDATPCPRAEGAESSNSHSSTSDASSDEISL